MHDVFQPHHEPAHSIYEAFQKEAMKRKSRSVEEWMKAERDAVFREAAHQAQKRGMRVPTMDEIAAAERYAMGSVDYGAKWAYSVVEAMRKSSNCEVGGGGAFPPSA